MATVISGVKSSVGSPYCYYTLTMTPSSRTATSVYVSWTLTASLASSQSTMGYPLTAYVYAGGGSQSKSLKGTETWSGTSAHSISGGFTVSGLSNTTTSISTGLEVVSGAPADACQLSYTSGSNLSISAWTSYTVSYNANGGSGAPSSQTKWKDQTLTLSSTKPTRTGYTFLGWSTSSTATTATYTAGGSYTANSSATLYAVWSENKLTVNYYSNYATSAFDDALNTVGSDKNVKVWTYDFYYDDDYSTYGLANYSSPNGSVYMTRTGYTGTGKWGTSTSGGTLIDEDAGYSTGQALAQALGKNLSSGNASVNIYAQWEENILTVSYYSNYADYGTYKGEALDVSADTNVFITTQEFLYDNSYSNGLADIQNIDYLYLTRVGYAPTGYWGTSIDGGALVGEKTSFDSGQALAEAVGKSLESGNATVNLYVQWKPSGVIYIDNGTTFEPYLPYIDNGTSWDLYLAYVDDGTNWNIIS